MKGKMTASDLQMYRTHLLQGTKLWYQRLSAKADQCFTVPLCWILSSQVCPVAVGLHARRAQMLWLLVRQLCWLRVHRTVWPWGEKRSETGELKHMRISLWSTRGSCPLLEQSEHCFGCSPGNHCCLFDAVHSISSLTLTGREGVVARLAAVTLKSSDPWATKTPPKKITDFRLGTQQVTFAHCQWEKVFQRQPLYRLSSFIFLEIKIHLKKKQ